MSGRHAASEGRAPGDGLVRAGALTFGVGVIGAVAVLVGFLLGSNDAPLWSTLLTLLLPLGLLIALVGLLQSARSRRKS